MPPVDSPHAELDYAEVIESIQCHGDPADPRQAMGWCIGQLDALCDVLRVVELESSDPSLSNHIQENR